jgi:hypothetical protein
MNISLNAKVNCSDGPFGYLDHIILKSISEEITHLVICDRNDRDLKYLVPIEFVAKSTHKLIQLNCTKDELTSMPKFTKEEYIPRSVFTFRIKPYLVTPHAVLPGRFIPIEVEQIPAGEFAVKKGAVVEALDGPVGYIDEFLVDTSNNSPSHITLRQGHLWGQNDVTLPIEVIERIEEDTVYLNISKQDIEALPTVPIHRFWIKKHSD